MKERSFLDTNVLVYTDDADNVEKSEIAINLVEETMLTRKGVISTQVLQEYFVAATRKMGLKAEQARMRVELFSVFDLVQIDYDDILNAINIHRLYGFSFWDSLIVNAAKRSNCSVIYTEDLQHGQQLEGLTIINPFI